MKKTWHHYYRNHRTSASNWLLHWQYLLRILYSRPKSVLELGCGPADHSIFLSRVRPGMEISLLDADKRIIDGLKKKLAGRIKDFFVLDVTEARQVQTALADKPQYDLMYSQGLLEHFTDDELNIVLQALLPFTKRMIFSVPSDAYPTRDFGNEILRSKQEWLAVLNKAKGCRFSVRPYFPDIGVRTKAVAFQRQKMNKLAAVRYFLLGSCHWLVEIVPRASN